METLNFCKIRDVKSPVRAHPADAGLDFFFPTNLTRNDLEKHSFSITGDNLYVVSEQITEHILSVILHPNQSVIIPSGIKVRIPTGYAMIFFNKSGVASKKHLHVGAQVIDENYTGECHINLTNVGTTDITLSAGDKLTQGIVLPINYCIPEEIPDEEILYKGFVSDRGSGAFGSTGTR